MSRHTGKMVYVNDRAISKKSSPDTLQIYSALQKAGINISDGVALNDASKILLDELGYTVSGEERIFTLIDDDTQTLDDENIFDASSYSELKPEKLSAKDSFTDPNDPFFQLDDAIPDNYQRQIEDTQSASEPSYVSLAATVGAM